jgi:hypothetical protein
MNHTTMRTMIAAAALAVAAGTASAQTYLAQIPMAFSAGGTVMGPGKYEVRVNRGQSSEIIFVHNDTNNTGVLLLAPVRGDPPKQWVESGAPKIAFACGNGACSLRKMWNGSDSFTYNFPASKAPAGDIVAHNLEMVTLTMIKAR